MQDMDAGLKPQFSDINQTRIRRLVSLMNEVSPNLSPENKGNLVHIVIANDGLSYSYLFLGSYQYLKIFALDNDEASTQYKTLWNYVRSLAGIL